MSRILITGCGFGFGSSLVTRLTEEGHEVIATVRSLEQKSLPSNIHSPSSLVEYMQMDVTNSNEIANVVEQLCKHNKTLDAVILNAASYAIGTIESADYAQIRQCFEVNYWGCINVVRAFLPLMRQQKSGKIIAVGSISSKVGLPCDGYYSATKAAMECTLESLRYEVAPFGIHVSMITPAAFSSNLFRSLPDKLPLDSPYSPLLNHWLGKTQSNDNKQGIQMIEVEDVVLTIISTKNPNFIYPVGAMATQVLDSLKTMTAEERTNAILTWSDTTWWSKIDFKEK